MAIQSRVRISRMPNTPGANVRTCSTSNAKLVCMRTGELAELNHGVRLSGFFISDANVTGVLVSHRHLPHYPRRLLQFHSTLPCSRPIPTDLRTHPRRPRRT